MLLDKAKVEAAIEGMPIGLCRGCDQKIPLVAQNVPKMEWRFYHSLPEGQLFCRRAYVVSYGFRLLQHSTRILAGDQPVPGRKRGQ